MQTLNQQLSSAHYDNWASIQTIRSNISIQFGVCLKKRKYRNQIPCI